MLRIFECYSKFSDKGAVQAILEISVLEGCLKYSLSREAQLVFITLFTNRKTVSF